MSVSCPTKTSPIQTLKIRVYMEEKAGRWEGSSKGRGQQEGRQGRQEGSGSSAEQQAVLVGKWWGRWCTGVGWGGRQSVSHMHAMPRAWGGKGHVCLSPPVPHATPRRLVTMKHHHQTSLFYKQSPKSHATTMSLSQRTTHENQSPKPVQPNQNTCLNGHWW